MIAVLAGGVGAARLLAGLVQVVDGSELTAIVNIGDDLVLHGLEISPDLDTVTYTLAGAIDPEPGWGLAGETWQAMETLRRYGGDDWFNLGDRDLGTHLYRRSARTGHAHRGHGRDHRGLGAGPAHAPGHRRPPEDMVTVEGEGEICVPGVLRASPAFGGRRRGALRRRRQDPPAPGCSTPSRAPSGW